MLSRLFIMNNRVRVFISDKKAFNLKAGQGSECEQNVWMTKTVDLSSNYTKATITRCDLSATILFKLVDSYLIAFKFAQ